MPRQVTLFDELAKLAVSPEWAKHMVMGARKVSPERLARFNSKMRARFVSAGNSPKTQHVARAGTGALQGAVERSKLLKRGITGPQDTGYAKFRAKQQARKAATDAHREYAKAHSAGGYYGGSRSRRPANPYAMPETTVLPALYAGTLGGLYVSQKVRERREAREKRKKKETVTSTPMPKAASVVATIRELWRTAC